MPTVQPNAPAAYMLPAVLDLNAAKPLAAALLAHAGTDLHIDASAVTHLGGLCLQVLLAAEAEWTGLGHGFVLADASDSFCAAAALMGADALLANQKHMEMQA